MDQLSIIHIFDLHNHIHLLLQNNRKDEHTNSMYISELIEQHDLLVTMMKKLFNYMQFYTSIGIGSPKFSL